MHFVRCRKCNKKITKTEQRNQRGLCEECWNGKM